MPRKGRERGRVKIQWIVDNKKRKKTLNRRLLALVKKAGELAKLCDVPVCLVAYRPDEAEPVIWPSPGGASDVVRVYRDLPELDRSRNKLGSTATDFVKKINDKARAKLSQVELQMGEAKIKDVIADFVDGRRDSLDDLPIDFFISVGMKVQDKRQAIHALLQEIRSAPPLLPPPLGPLPMVATPRLQHDVALTPLLLEMFDPLNVAGHGSALPTTEDMRAVFLHAGISPHLSNPGFDP